MAQSQFTIDPDKYKNKEKQIDNDLLSSFASNCIINGGKWVFLSNRIIAYWPLSIKKSSQNGHKYLAFHLLSIGLLISIMHALIDTLHTVHFILTIENELKFFSNIMDKVAMYLWDSLIFTISTITRILGVLYMPKIHHFWNQIVGIVKQLTLLTSQQQTEKIFKSLNASGLKWFILFSLLSGVIFGISVYYYFFVYDEPIIIAISALTSVILTCTHTSASFFYLFFISILTNGFTVCKRELGKLAPANSEGQSDRERSAKLDQILKLIRNLECCTNEFNNIFGVNLFLETVICFATIMLAMYSMHSSKDKSVVYIIAMLLQIVLYIICFVSLCVAGSRLTNQCKSMSKKFQEIPLSSISKEQGLQIQLVVQRLSAKPVGIYVSQLFQIQESLLSFVSFIFFAGTIKSNISKHLTLVLLGFNLVYNND
ncbi:unnamed protein product [Orchesella dallaii]|uniref:Gustatory receptor n=1 Tax=Orchesella dallaii TaxID=48710 RepID=A0ABP1PWN0_9HEXA